MSLVSIGDFAVTQSRIENLLRKSKNRQIDVMPDIIHALIDYKIGLRPSCDPYSAQGSDMIILYLTDKLENFQSRKLQKSIKKFAEENSVKIEEIPVNSGLSREIQNELNSSLIFEQNLEQLVHENEEYDSEPIETEHEMELEEFQPVSVYEPVVSLISPNLGLVAGPRALQHRLDFFARKRQRSSCPSVMTAQEDQQPDKKKVIKSHLVKNLNDKVQAELNSTLEFEQKLLSLQ